jgi:hypothetical protein
MRADDTGLYRRKYCSFVYVAVIILIEVDLIFTKTRNNVLNTCPTVYAL